jgi:uncharacterized surface protein with fasciclin (FAS1) repeats
MPTLLRLPSRFFLGTLLLSLCVTLTACDSNDAMTDPTPQTLADVVANTSALSTLDYALNSAGLASALGDSENAFTIFAPRNAAFDALTVDALADDPALLTSVLEYHVVEGEFGTNALSDGEVLTTLQGDVLTVSTSGTSIRVNGATLLEGAQVENGIIYIVDRVLLENRTAVERLSFTQNTQTLVQAISTAGLTDALNDPESSFTIFAPTESAFENVDVDALSQDELATILRYHVVPDAAVAAEDITDGQTATTLEGSDIALSIQDGSIFVNEAEVTGANFGVSNGIIHEIDGVLMPDPGVENQ